MVLEMFGNSPGVNAAVDDVCHQWGPVVCASQMDPQTAAALRGLLPLFKAMASCPEGRAAMDAITDDVKRQRAEDARSN